MQGCQTWRLVVKLATWEVHLAAKNRRWQLGDLLPIRFRAFGVFGEFLEPIWQPKKVTQMQYEQRVTLLGNSYIYIYIYS